MLLKDVLTRLMNIGFNPGNILDIGCYKGNWTREVSQIFPNAKFTLIDGIYYPEAESLGFDYKVSVLNEIETEVDWYEEKNTGDSMFQELTHFFKNTKPVKKQTVPLDSLFKDKIFSFIKIDCQGAEIPILKGGKDVASKAEFILLEMPFCGQYNKGVPDFKTHINFMDEIGFVPYDITEHHYMHNSLIQIDILFINKNSSILKIIQNNIEKIGL